MQRIYTAAQVAKILQVKKSYIYELIASRRIKFMRLSERRIRIPESAVSEFLKTKLDR
jgi:excisionase family DNA binding protein